MIPQEGEPRQLTWPAILFEAAFIPAAYLIGWLTGVWPQWELASARLGSLSAFAVGLVAALPLVAGLLWLDQLTWSPVARLRRLVVRMLGRLFGHAQWWQLALLALAAGVGEELLCRAWLQMWIGSWWPGPAGAVLGWLAAGVAFGLLHAVTWTYAWLAGLVGLYLGAMYVLTGQLLAPVVTHAVYDFFALLYLLRAARRVPPVATLE